ncbi:MAG: hypothetical protein KTR26_17985 [Flammeovirgaceae bacterium]|nr:hypothetical protein [Flammeovirgaceae bacterium]
MKMIIKTLAIAGIFFAFHVTVMKIFYLPIPKKQKVILQYFYVKHACGNIDQGWFIDNDRNIL